MGGLFDGTNDALSVATSTDFDFADALTIACWVNPDTGDTNRLIYRWASGEGYFLGALADTKWFFIIYASGGNVLITGGVLTPGDWHHIVGVRAADGSMTLYVNGAPVDTGSRSGVINNPATLFIAQDVDDANRLAGQICEVAIWGSELTQAQVSLLYAGGPFPVHRMPLAVGSDPRGYWPMHDASSGVVMSGARDWVKGNDLSIIGAPEGIAAPISVLGAGPLIVQAPAVVITPTFAPRTRVINPQLLLRSGGTGLHSRTILRS